MTTTTTRPACTRCGLNADALIHNATANGHDFAAPTITTNLPAVANPVVQRTVDGGYSGDLTVTVGTGNEGTRPMVFIDSDLLRSRLVLTLSEAGDLGFAISAAVAKAEWMEEGQPS